MNKSVFQGSSAIFSVQTGEDEFSFAWQKNNGNIDANNTQKFGGVLTTMLIVQNAQMEDQGMYSCMITNGAGHTVTSDQATLTVREYMQIHRVLYLTLQCILVYNVCTCNL